MPLKLNVGLTKKVGLPNYGSLGASCHLELELSASLLHDDLDGFHKQVKSAFVACAQAVNDELTRCQPTTSPQPALPQPAQPQLAPPQPAPAAAPAPGRTEATSCAVSNGQVSNGQIATDKQLKYVQVLARQVTSVGTRRLESLARRLYGKPPAELTSLQASGLIDTLKAIKDGQLDVDAALNGAAA